MDQFLADRQTNEDLIGIKDYFGSWDEVRERIKELEEADNEAAFERKYSY